MLSVSVDFQWVQARRPSEAPHCEDVRDLRGGRLAAVDIPLSKIRSRCSIKGLYRGRARIRRRTAI